MNNNAMSQIEMNKSIFNGTLRHIWARLEGIDGAKNDLRFSLDRLDDLNYVVEEMIASEAYPDLVGTYCKGTLIPKATSETQQTEKIINYRGISIPYSR